MENKLEFTVVLFKVCGNLTLDAYVSDGCDTTTLISDVSIADAKNAQAVGKSILDAFAYIRNPHVDKSIVKRGEADVESRKELIGLYYTMCYEILYCEDNTYKIYFCPKNFSIAERSRQITEAKPISADASAVEIGAEAINVLATGHRAYLTRTGLEEETAPTEKWYPWSLYLYKGENQLLYSCASRTLDWAQLSKQGSVPADSNSQTLGELVLDAIEYMRVGTLYHRDKSSDLFRQAPYIDSFAKKPKSWRAFVKTYMYVAVYYYENGTLKLCHYGRGSDGSYIVNVPTYEETLPATATVTEIGEAVIRLFAEGEKYYALQSVENDYNRRSFPLLMNESTEVSFLRPDDDNFINAQDYNASEIYQGYSYCKEGEESVAEFYFSHAAEFSQDTVPESDSIRELWEQWDGKADTFETCQTNVSVFTLRAEFRNKKTHRIAYYAAINNEELLACEMEVNLKQAGKRIDTKLTKLFEAFAKSVVLVEKGS